MRPKLAITPYLLLAVSATQSVQIPPPPSKAKQNFHWRWHENSWIEEPYQLIGLKPGQWNRLPTESDGRFFAIYGQVDGLEEPLRLLLDTGATESYLSEPVWKKFTNKDKTVAIPSPLTLKLTGNILLNMNVRPANLEKIDAVMRDNKVDGILGMRDIAKIIWKLDYAHNQVFVRLSNSDENTSQVSNMHSLQLPMRSTVDGRFSVELAVNNSRTSTIIDTGADGTSVAEFKDMPESFGSVKVVSAKGLLTYKCHLQEHPKLAKTTLPWMIMQTRKSQTPSILGVAGLGASQITLNWLDEILTLVYSDKDLYSSRLLTKLLGFPVLTVRGKLYLDSRSTSLDEGAILSNIFNMTVEKIGPYTSSQIMSMINLPSSVSQAKLTQLGKLTRKGTSLILTDRKQSLKVQVKSLQE